MENRNHQSGDWKEILVTGIMDESIMEEFVTLVTEFHDRHQDKIDIYMLADMEHFSDEEVVDLIDKLGLHKIGKFPRYQR